MFRPFRALKYLKYVAFQPLTVSVPDEKLLKNRVVRIKLCIY